MSEDDDYDEILAKKARAAAKTAKAWGTGLPRRRSFVPWGYSISPSEDDIAIGDYPDDYDCWEDL